MAHDKPLDRLEVSFDFNLPHGIDVEDNSAPMQGLTIESEAQQDPQNTEQQDLNYRQFSPGFSDDEGRGDAFERSWPSHQAEKQATKAAKGKKSPRRSDNDDDESELTVRAKKPRQSLFGRLDEDIEDEEQITGLVAPATPGHGIGNRMSSLSLDEHVDEGDDLNQVGNTGFNLACSDIGSICNSPIPSDEEVIIPPDNVGPYELRQNIDRKKAFTYVDTDKSGTWDPEQDAKERSLRLNRARAAKKEKKGKTKKTKKTKKGFVPKRIVKLSFDAFGNVRNITNDEQNWPDDWSDIDSDQERELNKYRGFCCNDMLKHEVQLPLEDPAGEVENLIGHPAARGCKQCRKLKRVCSIVKSGRYPCTKCIEEDDECQLIQEPTEKGRCKQCDEVNEELCSFEDDPTQAICNHCADNDYICEALPPDGYKTKRIDLDEIVYGPNRPYVACTACREEKKRCSLKGKEDKSPCNRCKKNDKGCTFREVDKPETQKQTAKKKNLLEAAFTPEDIAYMDQHNDDRAFSRDRTPEMEMTDSEGNKGILTKINTSFAHPIKFNVTRHSTSDCNFCDIPIYGIIGYFEREVHVIRWDSGHGYSETGGGFCSDNGQTTMCTDCTLNRVQIIVCGGHTFESLPDACEDFGILANELLSAESGSPEMQYQLQRWCSLCFFPASFGCSTIGLSLAADESEVTGCGLRLCTSCEKGLREDFNGDFAQMVAKMAAQPKVSEADELTGHLEGKARADVGFLEADGLLMWNSSLEE